MSDAHRLPKEQHDEIYQTEIASYYLPRSKAQSNPCAFFTGGQPGSGKSGLAALATERFRATGYVLGDADKLRPYHPGYRDLMRGDDRTAANLTHFDCGPWAARLIQDGVAGRRNIIVDQTSRDPVAFAEASALMRGAGYRVELHVMATPALVSEQRIYERYEGQRAKDGFGRFSTKAKHDEAFAGLAETVQAVEIDQLADRLCVYNRNCQPVYDNQLVRGNWQQEPRGREALELERARLMTIGEAQQFTNGYGRLVNALAETERAATPREQAAMQARYAGAQILQAQVLLGNPNADVRQADATGVYVGTIVGETPTHWIQRLSPNTAILHDKSRTPELAIGQAGALRYRAGQAGFTPDERSPGRGLSR